jgi:hypothetical protein
MNSHEARAHILDLVRSNEYAKAHEALLKSSYFSPIDRAQFKSEVSKTLLLERHVEWTHHGIRKTFRFYTPSQKHYYLKKATELIAILNDFTPHVVLGFGAVLGFVRDGDFIPHDDDLDLLVAIPPIRFAEAKAALSEFFAASGFVIKGQENLSHLTVHRPKEPGFDIFPGFTEGEWVSWFPSNRKVIRFDEVFPPVMKLYHDVEIPLPRQPERYLELTYGPEWGNPLPHWNHPWDQQQYQDFL